MLGVETQRSLADRVCKLSSSGRTEVMMTSYPNRTCLCSPLHSARSDPSDEHSCVHTIALLDQHHLLRGGTIDGCMYVHEAGG